jgi:oxygen-independent coproporphyrinogen-3 oxidase
MFYKNINNIKLPEDEVVIDYDKKLLRILNKYKFKRYEVSNYCRNNNKCVHNMTYWKYNNYLGLGPSAHSTIDDLRIENEPDIIKYINNDNYKNNIKLSIKDRLKEYILMGLRLIEGIDIVDFNSRFKMDFYLNFDPLIKKYKKFIKKADDSFSLNKRGLDILNKILIDFFERIDALNKLL